jgi:hypothetical protein
MLNGRIDIQYRRVECTPPVPVKVQIDGNSGTGGWLRLAVTVCSSCFAIVFRAQNACCICTHFAPSAMHVCLCKLDVKTSFTLCLVHYVVLEPVLLKCASSQPSQYRIPDKPGSLQTNGGSGGVKTVQVKGPNSGWEGLSNTFGAEWEIPNQPSLPIDLHVISDSGQEVSTSHTLHTHPAQSA